MQTQAYWIEGDWPGRLAVSSRPRGDDWLEEEVDAWQKSGVKVVVSLLTEDEATELGLKQEGPQVQRRNMEFIQFPIPDREVPSSAFEFSALVDRLGSELANGTAILIHCRHGIGRAGLLAIGVLLAKGSSVEGAIRRVVEVRGTVIPETADQRRWIEDFSLAR